MAFPGTAETAAEYWILDFGFAIFDLGNRQSKITNLKSKIKSARLVWATTTPVIDERHNAVKEFDRYQRDVEVYNRVAAAIMTDAGIAIDDLYSAIQNDDIGACLGADGVHMTERGNNVLTDAVCKCILHELRYSEVTER